jgi:predicted RNA-binding protein with PUA-like domain
MMMLCRAPKPVAARLAARAMAAKRPRAAATSAAATAEAAESNGLWLLKSEPDERFEKGVKVSCSAADLEAMGPAGCAWEGVRNYGARNALRAMKTGDRCLLQHTGKAAAVVAVLRCTREAYAEEAQFDAAGPCAPKAEARAA